MNAYVAIPLAIVGTFAGIIVVFIGAGVLVRYMQKKVDWLE